MPVGHRLTREQVDYIRDNFSDKTNYQLCEETGLSRSTIYRVQRIYNLHKYDEHIHNMGVRAGKASDLARGGIPINTNTPECIAKRVASYKKRVYIENLRYKYGLEQKTKIRIMKVCRRASSQRNNLLRRGYIIDDVNKVAYWTPETQRTTRLERLKRGETKGHYKSFYDFMPYAGQLDQ